MPISLGQNLGTLLKTAASGLIQSILPKPKDEPGSRTSSTDAHNEEATLSSHYFTDSVIVTPPSRTQESQIEHPELDAVTSQNQWAESEQAQLGVAQGDGLSFENQTPQVQRMLQSWLQLDPKSIAGLEKFIEAEFQHSPENAEMYLSFQVMRMLKEARQLIEQNELAGLAKQGSESSEEAQRAMTGASFLGYAYFKKLRKRANVSRRLVSNITHQEQEAVYEEGLQAAAHFLKKAEEELQKAMNQAEDEGPFRKLLSQVGDTYKAIEFMLARKMLLKKIPA